MFRRCEKLIEASKVLTGGLVVGNNLQGDYMLENRIVIVMTHPYIDRGLIKVCSIIVGPFKSLDGARKFLMMNEFEKQNTGKRRAVWRGYYDDAFDWEWDAEIQTTQVPFEIEEKGL